MFEQAASDNGAGMRPGSAAPKRPTWGAARGPSLAEQIKKIADNDSSVTRVDLSNQAAYQCKPDEYTAQIAAAIKKNKYLKELRLEGVGLGDREAAVLAEGIAANSSITVLDLQKNRINNDGGAALAKGIANNTTLVEINLMNQPSRWGDGCLDAFLAMFDTNITLLKINWRLESRKSFALNKMITRNNEIDRRKKNGMAYHDLLPTALKGSAEGKENIPTHTASTPAPPVSSSAPVSAGVPDEPAAHNETQATAGPVHQPEPAAASSDSVPQPRINAGGWAGGQFKPPSVASAGAGSSEEQKPLAGVPKVKRAMPSVLSRWPPAQQET